MRIARLVAIGDNACRLLLTSDRRDSEFVGVGQITETEGKTVNLTRKLHLWSVSWPNIVLNCWL